VSKDPGPEARLCFATVGVIWVITFTSSVQVSGFGCQVSATDFDALIGVAHVVDFPSSVLAFSCNPISVQDLGFDFY
jgi:hypothetical protein